MAEGQGRSSNQGVKLLYIRDYLHKYTNKEHPKSAKEISEYLASKGIKAERKTIYNDILRLQMDFQEPIEYNSKKWGYYITKPQFTSDDLRMLLDSVRLSELLTSEETFRLYGKILSLANIYDAEYFSEEVKQLKLIWKSETSITRSAELIREAIKANKKISFRYFHYVMDRGNNYKEYYRPNETSDIYVLDPKELICSHKKYYLATTIGDEERFFPLEFMEDIKILSQNREIIVFKGRSQKKSKLNGRLIEREKYTLDLDKEYAVTILTQSTLIREIFHFWGNDVPVIPYDENNVMFTVHTKLSISRLYTWMIRWGPRSKILAPIEAIGEFAGVLNEMLSMYEYGTPNYLENIPSTYDEMREQKHNISFSLKPPPYKK